MVDKSGSRPFAFSYRDDLHTIPAETADCEVNLHGGFARDHRDGQGQLYYGMPGCGIVRIEADLQQQNMIQLPERLAPLNFHSTKLGQIGGTWYLFLPANNDELVAVINLDGKLEFILSRPEFDDYQNKDVPFNPTDTVLVEDQLFVADGYGSNYISSANVHNHQWIGIFGGKADDPHEHGKFTTAHGINLDHNHQHLVIADRPSSRIQVHRVDGEFIESKALPSGVWPCGIDYVEWDGRWLAVIGCLRDTEDGRPAPIYVVDAISFDVLSVIRPKEELGIELAQHLHNVVWHVHAGNLFLICQSWNPGYYFVLERSS